MNSVIKAIALGVATAARSQLGPAAVAWSAQPSTSKALGARAERFLSGTRTRRGLAVSAVGELVGDKLPKTPSRLEPLGLVPRLGFGALGGTILAARAGESEPAAAAAGLLAAAAWSYAGVQWRGWAAKKLGRDLPGALAEDVLAVALAGAATGLWARRSH